MKKVVNPKDYEKFVEYWDKGDGKTNQLKGEKRKFQSQDINIVIFDEPVSIKVGGSAILPDSVAQTLLVRFPYLVVSEPDPVVKKKATKIAKRVPKKKYEKTIKKAKK